MNKITDEELKKFEDGLWSEFLSKATPVEIHQAVITSNCDNNSYLLNWIKNNPKVDKATVLIAYWMSAPRWRKQYANREEALLNAPREIHAYDFVEEVEQKYPAGFWKENRIGIDPACDQDGYNWTDDYRYIAAVREIPEIMYRKLDGKKVVRSDDFDEGLPVGYAQRLYDLFEQLETE
jgi:hypothetical protein